MRLDIDSLEVESFAVGTVTEFSVTVTSDTGRGGPDSLCYICYETGNTVPSCGLACDEPAYPVIDTFVHPSCTWA